MTRAWIKLAIVGSAGVWLTGLVLAAQTPAPAAGKKAGEAFKNVTTSTLKELSVDDFIASMGLISANLGLDCLALGVGGEAERQACSGADQSRSSTSRPRSHQVPKLGGYRMTTGNVPFRQREVAVDGERRRQRIQARHP